MRLPCGFCVASRWNFCRGSWAWRFSGSQQWPEKAIAGIDASLKERKGDPVKAELDMAMKRIGELIMQVPQTAGGQDGDVRPFGSAEVAAMSAAILAQSHANAIPWPQASAMCCLG